MSVEVPMNWEETEVAKVTLPCGEWLAGNWMTGGRGRYHRDGHDGGIGNVDFADHVRAV